MLRSNRPPRDRVHSPARQKSCVHSGSFHVLASLWNVYYTVYDFMFIVGSH